MLMMIMLSASIGVFAQNNNWANLKNIPKNSALIVDKKDGKTIKGHLVSLDNLEMKLKDKNGETKLDKDAIKRVYQGIEKRKIPLWGRITAGIATFSVIAIGVGLILKPEEISNDLNSLDLLGLAAATAGTVISIKLLRKLKTLKKGNLLYEAK